MGEPLARTRLLDQEGVLPVVDLGRPPTVEDSDPVEATGGEWTREILEEDLGGAHQSPALLPGDGVEGVDPRGDLPASDLDEDQDFLVPGDEVDLSKAADPVLQEDSIPLGLEKSGREVLGPVSPQAPLGPV